MVSYLMKKTLLRRRRLLIKGRVVWSKVKMLVSKLPLSLSFFFFVGIWLHRPCNYDNYFFFFNAYVFLW